MELDQIVQEIRELNDVDNRHEAAIDTLVANLAEIRELAIPAAIADIGHSQLGQMELMTNVAGTVHKLAMQLAALCDRTTLLERETGGISPPVANTP